MTDQPRILVIRGGAIGDFILTLPAIGLLREAFPQAHLEILGYQHIIALAAGRFYADAARSIEYGPLAGFFNPKSTLAPDLVEYFAGFQQIVSYLFDPDGFFEGNLRRAGAKNILPAWRKVDDSDHAARQLARPLEQLALYLDHPGARLFPSDADRTAAAAFLGDGAETWVAIHPGSGGAKKNWPLERWAALGRRLAAHPSQPRLLLIGGEADGAQLAALEEAWRGLPVRVARDLPLTELAAVLARCALFLGHDTGISHVAAAVGTRCLLLFGPTDPDIWAPAHPHVSIVAAPGGMLAALSEESVWEKAAGLLAPAAAGSAG